MTTLRKYTRALVANESQTLDVPPSELLLCSSGSGVFTVSPENQNPVDVELGIGLRFDGPNFTKLRLLSSTTQTVSLYVGRGEVIDNRLVGNVDISGGIRLAGSLTTTYGAVTVGVAATLIKAANASRASIIVQNLGTVAIYVGPDAGITTANAIKVEPSNSATLDYQGTIYAISGSAGQDVRYLEDII